MAETKLADMIVPEEFNSYVTQLSTEKSRLFTSGIMTDLTPVIDDQIAGKTVNMPFFQDLDAEVEDQIIDDTKDAVVAGTSVDQDVSVKLLRMAVFGASDLAADLSGADPLDLIQNRFAEWWNKRHQRTLLSTLNGAMFSAGMEDNVFDISGLEGDAAVFDADSFIDAIYRLGDESSALSAMAVTSGTMKAMVKADLIDYAPDSQGKLTVPTYMGKLVIEDDKMPVTGTGRDRVYTSFIFGPGAIGYGEKSPKVPVEVERQALKGMGQEVVVHRRQWVMHPRGVKWKGSSAGPTPTNAELANPAAWERVYEAKQIRIVAFRHKLPV
ncbi:major capsid protein [uncultured Methylobacterium sp.]|jgi:hypothetical protein|uniref:major capsid protein n=1 Tax=uncultured Methylobacterium sp. TaxID=157278 RepID=UPI00260DD80A|nr:major capsid protein [uncultured Methylobacterium sp.]